MAQAKTRSSSTRKASSQAQRKSAQSRSSRASSGGSTAKKSRSGSQASRNGSSSRNGSASARPRAQSNGHSSLGNTVVAGVGTVAGLVGGVVIGSRFARKPKRILGVKVPGTGGGMHDLAKQVGKASKQLGELTGEVRAARQKAEQVGKVIS